MTPASSHDSSDEAVGGGGVLGALTGPLMLPGRVLRDLETISESVRTLPSFERTLIARLDEICTEVEAIRIELVATRRTVAELSDQVGDAVEHLPGHDSDGDSRGRFARARDAISGQGS